MTSPDNNANPHSEPVVTRPAGVTASAVVAIIGSMLALGFAGLMFATPYLAPPSAQPPPVNLGRVAFTVGLICVALAALGIATGLGLLRMRAWARTSILVFAGIMGGVSLVAGVATTLVPPPTLNAPAGVASTMRWVIAGVYAVPLLIAVWWLVLFNKQSTRDAFARVALPGEGPSRPPSISIIGWWYVISGVLCVIPAAVRLPALIGTMVITGWGATAFFVILGALNAALGWGVLKLQERARVLMIAWLALSAAYSAYVAIAPGPRQRMRELGQSLPAGASSPTFDTTAFIVVMMLVGVVLVVVAIWFLVRNKAAFHSDEERAAPGNPISR